MLFFYGAEAFPSLQSCASLESSQFQLLASLRTLRATLVTTTANSNTASTTTNHDTASFVERNLARAELAHSKLETLRRAAEEAEASTMQATPRINNKSRSLAQRGRPHMDPTADGGAEGAVVSIANRQTKRYQEELERRDRVRKEREEKQISDLQQTPKINKRSRQMATSQRKKMNTAHQSLADRQAERRRLELLRHEEKKKRQEQITMEEMRRTKPRVSKGSARILKKMEREGKRTSSKSALSVGDRLYKNAEVLQEKKKKKAIKPQFKHTPNTKKTNRSAAAQAETVRRERIEKKYGLGVSDRLYLEAQAKEHRMAMATAESKLWEQYDAVTGEELFQPKITENRGTGRNKEAGRVRGRGGSNETVPVHVRLAQKQQEYTDKRKKKEQRKIQQISNMSNKTVTPTMSSNSKHLVQQMEQRGDITPTSQRLQQNIGAVRQRTIEEIDHPTFRPRIHQAPSARKQKLGPNPNHPKKNTTAVDRLKKEGGDYVPSPGKVAKHSSALSREEVIEYRQLQKEGRERGSNGGGDGGGGGGSGGGKGRPLKKAPNATTKNNQRKRSARLQTRTAAPLNKKKKIKTAATTRTAQKNSRTHTTVSHLPNRHRKGNTPPTTGKPTTTATTATTATRRAPNDATSNLLRARLLSSRRRKKTPTQPSQQQQNDRSSENRTLQYTTPRPSSAQRPALHREEVTSLPNGWNEYVNEQGFVYYAHSDGRTQWNTPTRRQGPEETNRRRQQEQPATAKGSPSREELDNMIRGMGSKFLSNWKRDNGN